jgi:TonB family protein
MNRWLASCALLVLTGAGCGDRQAPDPPAGDAAPPGFEAPVLINSEVPVRYPPDLYRAGTEGTVVLRLFVDETGVAIADSVRIAEGSGMAAFDSAAVAAVSAMQFAPARRDGRPVGVAFLQPVHFRHPGSATPEGGS